MEKMKSNIRKQANTLYNNEQYNKCLKYLYRNTFSGKFAIWALITLSYILSAISITISMKLSPNNVAVVIVAVAAAAAVAGIAAAVAGVVAVVIAGGIVIGGAAAAAVAGIADLSKIICKIILKRKGTIL